MHECSVLGFEELGCDIGMGGEELDWTLLNNAGRGNGLERRVGIINGKYTSILFCYDLKAEMVISIADQLGRRFGMDCLANNCG